MKKYYQANTAISINVVLKSKKSMHIAFTVQSDGRSVYITDNADIQYALEHHYKFGRLFKLTSAEEETEDKAGEKSAVVETEAAKEETRKVSVSDLGAAKEYLSETLGISRTSLRSEKAILDAAKAHNIEFEGI